MNTCLISTLKGDALNSTLPKLGTWLVTREVAAGQDWDYSTDYFYVNGKANTPFTIESDDVTEIYFAGTIQTLPYEGAIGGGSAYQRTIAFSQKGTVRISSKYNDNLYGISNTAIDSNYNINKTQQLVDFCVKTNPANVKAVMSEMSSIYGDLKELLIFENIQKISLSGTQVQGNISIMRNLIYLEELNLSDTNVSGNFGVLGNLTNIISMFLAGTQIEGNIETFVHNSVTKGRTIPLTSPIRINGVFTAGVTFYGLNINYTSAFLSWESDARIVAYVGGAYISDAYTRVYAVGATAEEITAWKTANKQVYAYENDEWLQK